VNPALQKILEDLSKRGQLVRAGKGWLAPCPGHDDRQQSLSVGEGKDGRVLLNDFAGCTVEAICAAAGWSMADLFPEKERGAMNVVATYEYRDEQGELLNQVLRLEPKSFRQRRPDGNGGWIYQLGDVRRVLYRLHDLLKLTKKRRSAVLLVEGEKDVDALWDLKLPATTCLGGAGAWREEYAEQLVAAGVKRVAILPDNDDAGRRLAHTAAASLTAAGIEVRVVELPALPPKGDVSDFLKAAQFPRGDLVRALQAGVVWTPETATPPEPARAEEGGDWLEGGKGLDETPLEYIVEGMVPLGMMGSISGRDGRGKSLLGLEIAKAVLTGDPLFESFEAKKGVVYLVLLDDPENMISARLKSMGLFGHPNLYVKVMKHFEGQQWDENRVEMLKTLAENIARRARELHDGVPVFILLDALYLFVPHGGRSGADQGNSSGAMLPIMEAFDKIARPGHVTVGVVIHNNKADTDIQGSQSIRNMLKWVLMLSLPKKYEKDRQGGRVTPDRILQLGKIKTGQPAEWGFRLRGLPDGNVAWDSVDLADLEASDKKKAIKERREKISDWLQFYLSSGVKTPQEVREAGWGDGQRFGWKDIEIAAKEIGVEKVSQGGKGTWLWKLKGQS
jgi:5S rRNA maturation endonuclease (ribonuclease M5)